MKTTYKNPLHHSAPPPPLDETDTQDIQKVIGRSSGVSAFALFGLLEVRKEGEDPHKGIRPTRQKVC